MPSLVRIDECLPRHCEEAGHPHQHCICGQAMSLDADLCDDCRREGLDLPAAVPDDEAEAWDGQTYASRRRVRELGPNPDSYGWLLLAILEPEIWERSRAAKVKAAGVGRRRAA
jgi:hypothetical protein